MKRLRKSRKCQAILEFAIAFILVVASLVAVSFILNARGVFQNHFRDVLTYMGI